MPIPETIAKKLSSEIIKWFVNQRIKQFTKSDYNEYEKELHRIIDLSTEEYKQKFNVIKKIGQLHFCDSQIILTELIKFRLSKKPIVDEIKAAIDRDARVEPPTSEEIKNFIEIFSKNLKASSKLDKLNIENNYKEEIFNISENLNIIKAAITDLKKEVPTELIEEWSRRLDEVTENIEKFKPVSALDILTRLENRIADKEIKVSDALKGKIVYLKATCSSEQHMGEINQKSAEQFIMAYKYCPDKLEFKANASIAYFVLGDNEKAETIADEILQNDEYHSGAWALKVFLSNKEFSSLLNELSPIVKNKRDFKALVGHWIVNKGYIGTISELDELGFKFEINDFNEPPEITRKNKWYWTLVIYYLINKLYELNPQLSFFGFDSKITSDSNYIYAHSLLKKLTKAIEGSEI